MTIDLGKPINEFISPEGIEEKVVEKETYMITQTQGGKFRLYVLIGVDGKCESKGVYETKDKAKQHMAMIMGLSSSLIIDAKGTIKAVIEMVKKRDDPNSAS